jgi:MoxR-like ATPase
LQGRDFVTPEDVKYVADAILSHRIQLTPEKEMEGFTPAYIVQQIVESVEIPR